jgi:type III pantothenate kinase
VVLLAIDVGNTQTVVGLFETGGTAAGRAASRRGGEVRGSRDRPGGGGGSSSGDGPGDGLLFHWRLATAADRTSDEMALLVTELLDLEGLDIDEVISGVAVSSGVPRLTAALRGMVRRRLAVPLVVIEPGVRTGMPILIESPKEVGADRVANAVAAFEMYGGPTVVVDLGTATTFDAVSAKGEYLGGAIAPGIEVGVDALVDRAAALRRVELVEAPRSVIGKGTVEALQSGALFGCAAMVEGMCRRFEDELGPSTVVATGGLSSLVAPLSPVVDHQEPWLTLYGLRIVFERNV